MAAISKRSAVMTRDRALEWLDRRINFERVVPTAARGGGFRLGTMRRLLAAVGSPEKQFRVVHVAGTKGKGSTVAMLSAVLGAAGHRVGRYLSPHVHAIEERISVGGRPISSRDLVRAFEVVIPAVELLDKSAARVGRRGPTWFEVLTAVAFVHFARSGIDLAVIETGLGGRLDATNVSRPVLSIITSIGMDHMRLLGDTITAIAGEKAGIIKRGCPVISGAGSLAADRVIAATAARRRAPLLQLGRDFEHRAAVVPSPRGTAFNRHAVGIVSHTQGMPPPPAHAAEPYGIGMPGMHQVSNASLVVVAARMLDRMGWPIPDAAVEAGIRETVLPARIEVRSRRPLMVVDAAHNVDSMAALMKTIASMAGRRRSRVLVFAASGDKQIEEMLATARGMFVHLVLTRYLTNPRAASLDRLVAAAKATGMRKPQTAKTPREAVRLARSLAGRDGLICVAGSFFLAAEV
ncbi:MAG: bifunctional folylpolyglutamate synthase/dihydrofolate synthase [Planctomycetia bacterium]